MGNSRNNRHDSNDARESIGDGPSDIPDVETIEEFTVELDYGEVRCDICDIRQYIDINDIAEVYQWMEKHIFGHVGRDNSKKKTHS